MEKEDGRISFLPIAKRLMRDFAANITLTEKAVLPNLLHDQSFIIKSGALLIQSISKIA